MARARSKRKKALGPVGLLIVAALTYAYLEWQKSGGDGGFPQFPSWPAEVPAGAVQGNFEILSGCRLTDDRNNDGDSFVVVHDGNALTLRLYFVDAPEKRRHQYNGERIGHQARYFGVSPDRAIEVGVAAKEVALGMLEHEPFTVFTLWEEVYDSGRYYAFVRFPDGGYLSERLVNRGLARIYTKGEDLPDGRSMGAFKSHLQGLEAQAKAAGAGAWRR